MDEKNWLNTAADICRPVGQTGAKIANLPINGTDLTLTQRVAQLEARVVDLEGRFEPIHSALKEIFHKVG